MRLYREFLESQLAKYFFVEENERMLCIAIIKTEKTGRLEF